MKCIKTQGKYKRVSDERAERLVRSGTAVYVPKHEYKRGEPCPTPCEKC